MRAGWQPAETTPQQAGQGRGISPTERRMIMTNAEKKADVKQFGTVFIMLGNDRASQDQLLAAMIRVLAQGAQSIEPTSA